MQKGQVFIWIIVGALVIAVAGGVLFYTNYSNNRYKTPVITSQTPQPTPVATPDETANWKEYTNNKFGFVIKYPENLEVTMGTQDFVVAFEESINSNLSGPLTGSTIEVDIQENPQRLEANEWAKLDGQKTCTIKPCEPSLNFGDEVVVSGIKTSVVSGQLPRWTQEAVYLPYKGKVYIIRATSNVSSKIKQTFRKMLPTFKFTQ